MLRSLFLSIALIVASAATALAAYPYDSICEILVPEASGYSGGSATLIAVSDTQALLLTAQHVVSRPGKSVKISWPATGAHSKGKVIRIAPNGLDAALILCPRPDGLRPVPVAPIDPCKSEYIVNAGFPGITGTLEWQAGKVTDLTKVDLRYSCRPIPGMSGGCTFDQYGNLVGIIQYYSREGGGSTSGVAMLTFLRDYILENTVAWEADYPQRETFLEQGTPESQIVAPSAWNEFIVYLYEEYETGPFREFLDDGKEIDLSETPDLAPKDDAARLEGLSVH